MITNKKSIKELLVKKGIKPTYQRISILNYLQSSKEHPTADMVYRKIVKEIPVLSKTTVYNTLNKMAKEGVVNRITIKPEEARFDINEVDHHHFLCKKCKKIMDIDIRCPNFAKGSVNGNIIHELHGYFVGICRNCK